MTITVTIKEHSGEYRETTLVARTDDLDVAIERCIAKGYGKGRDFCRDYGLSVGADALQGTQYGQIGRPCKTGGTSLITGRVSIRAERS